MGYKCGDFPVRAERVEVRFRLCNGCWRIYQQHLTLVTSHGGGVVDRHENFDSLAELHDRGVTCYVPALIMLLSQEDQNAAVDIQ